MAKYELIMFDMDGTLIDPKQGMTNAIQYTLSQFGIEEKDTGKLTNFIGMHQNEAYKNYYGFDNVSADKAVEIYRAYYKEQGIKQNKLYDGVKELLDTLKQEGRTLAIATLKPTHIAEAIIRHFNIGGYFDLVVGSKTDGSRHNKTEIIRHILDIEKNIKSHSVMIGDRKGDIIGASANGITSIGAGYGYGSPGELEKEHPSYIVNNIGELKKVLV